MYRVKPLRDEECTARFSEFINLPGIAFPPKDIGTVLLASSYWAEVDTVPVPERPCPELRGLHQMGVDEIGTQIINDYGYAKNSHGVS
jgi:hypothetical protein